ncbi:unnamed protein product [Gongylonema pulchrum]|uniref:COP9 signalosome complex subunit 6 n=1 Tax=Gongylonema pulchrum TaxID=637853 RepID=A0A183DZA0_9BILA|nr:unnamed protein product [Gongylonema pulchrum]
MGDDASGRGGEAPSSAVTVSLHPLVIMNISEHVTRMRAQQNDPKQPIQVFGAILGVQSGRHVEMKNSFEVKWADEGKGYALPLAVYESVPTAGLSAAAAGGPVVWHSVHWTLASEQAERIGIEHVAQISTDSTSIRAGELPRDEHIIREIAQLVHRIPLMNSEKFSQQYKNVWFSQSAPVLLFSERFIEGLLTPFYIAALPDACPWCIF